MRERRDVAPASRRGSPDRCTFRGRRRGGGSGRPGRANPSDQPVSLASYYLADTGLYFRLPAGAPTLDATDFIAKFPSGAMIGPRGVVTVAIDTAAAFQSTYGVAPTYSVADGTMQVVAGTGATLTNAGELIALFWWDGQDDRVRDVDLLLAGVPTTANGLVDKSGVAIDGPDADAIPTAYLPDARTMTAQASTPGSGKSTQRILAETGHEIQAGTGNGLTGHDETSENTSATWDSTFGTPTPGVVPPTLLP